MQIRTTGQVHNGYPTGDVDCEGPEPCRETGSHGPVRAVLDHFQAEGTPERGLSLQARKSLIISPTGTSHPVIAAPPSLQMEN